MTQKLKSLMDRAADVDFAPIDLAAITGDGDRVVRRRRLGFAAGVAAAAVTVGVLVAVNGGTPTREDNPPVVDSSPGLAGVNWVEGDRLHWPTRSIDIGAPVVAYVRNAAGHAFVAEDGRILTLRDGRAVEIGRAWRGGGGHSANLVADGETGLVGWTDNTGSRPAFVVYDLASGEESRHDEETEGLTEEDRGSEAYFFAIEDGTAYWLDRRGTVATDLATGESRVVFGRDDSPWVGGVENGLLVRLVESGGKDVGVEITDLDGRVVLPVTAGVDLGVLSPDGRWVTSSDGVSVVEVRTGRRVSLGDGLTEGVGYEWLDADTVAVVHERDHSHLDLLVCEVPAGTCSVVQEGLDSASDGLTLPGAGILFGLSVS